MRKLITNDLAKCVSCNRCIRVCPVDEANVAYMEGDVIKVRVDNAKCIACGACLHACRHQSRLYEDDTERFFADLRKGTPISLMCAPAARSNLDKWDRVLALLQQMGARKIYDVSLGADICVWGYIRYIQKYNPPALITQPCPAIVDYILMHQNDLLPYLAPVQSPMMSLAVYMKKYQGITDKIAAISPCIAKANEFDQNGGMISYNVTFIKLEEYIQRNNLQLPAQGRGYDHINSGLGSIFPMPGGLRENVEFMIGKTLRIDKSEGQNVVYAALDEYCKEDKANLPTVFDVLNCAEGCNLGTGCHHEKSVFKVNASMDKARQDSLEGRDREYFEQLYQQYDRTLRLDDFLRRYRPAQVHGISATDSDIENAFAQLGKLDASSRAFDCGACGSDTCHEMAVKIAKKVNIPENCIQKAHTDLNREHGTVVKLQQQNAEAINAIAADIVEIKELADKNVDNVANIDKLINLYEMMAKEIDKIASNIHMISLNASIEAARAGEHGRSFAVVAEAIRSLAGDTQGATANITKATTEAKRALGDMSGVMVTIGENVHKAHTDVNEIAARTQAALVK